MNITLKKLLAPIEYTVCSIIMYYIIEWLPLYKIGVHGVFFTFIHSAEYHEINPIAFILITGFGFFLTQMTAHVFFLCTKRVFLRYVLFFTVWMFLSCVLGAVLWSYYDMEAGWIPTGNLLISKVWTDIKRSIIFGPFVVFLSIPYNLFILILSILILRRNKILNNDTQLVG